MVSCRLGYSNHESSSCFGQQTVSGRALDISVFRPTVSGLKERSVQFDFDLSYTDALSQKRPRRKGAILALSANSR